MSIYVHALYLAFTALRIVQQTLRGVCCYSITRSRPTLGDPKDCSTPGFPVLGCLLEFAQIHVHWAGDAISPSATLFSFCLQSFLTSESFPKSWLFTSGGQSIGASTSALVLPMRIQCLFPLGLTGLISFQSKRISRVFFNTTVQKHPFFGTQLSLWSNSHDHTWLLEKSYIS